MLRLNSNETNYLHSNEQICHVKFNAANYQWRWAPKNCSAHLIRLEQYEYMEWKIKQNSGFMSSANDLMDEIIKTLNAYDIKKNGNASTHLILIHIISFGS